MVERVVGGTGNSQTVQFQSGRQGTLQAPEGEKRPSFQLAFGNADKYHRLNP